MSNVMISALGLTIENRTYVILANRIFIHNLQKECTRFIFPCSADITILTEKNMLSANPDDDNKEKSEVLDKDKDNDNDIDPNSRQTNEEEKAVIEPVDHIETCLDLILLQDVIKLKLRASIRTYLRRSSALRLEMDSHL